MTPLDGFLAQAALEADDKNQEGVSDSVQMMTVHASKGLEFPNVWLCGLEDGLFPHHARDEAEEDKAISEERRLMYVAMTRAQKRLRISWCAQRMLYGDIKYQDRSQFIDEIPEEHVRELKAPKKDDDAGDYRGGYGGSRYGSYGNGGYSRGYGNNGYSRGGYAGRDNSYGARSSAGRAENSAARATTSRQAAPRAPGSLRTPQLPPARKALPTSGASPWETRCITPSSVTV